MELKSFKAFTREQRKAVNRISKGSGSEDYDCAGKVYSPFRVKRSKQTGKFENKNERLLSAPYPLRSCLGYWRILGG